MLGSDHQLKVAVADFSAAGGTPRVEACWLEAVTVWRPAERWRPHPVLPPVMMKMKTN